MKKIIIFSTLVLFILAAISCEKMDVEVTDLSPELGMINHPNEANYQSLINKILETGVPGVSMTVITPEGTWSGTGGKADLDNNVDLTPYHIMRIGSASKLFCAATILRLQDESKLNIYDKASQYIPAEIAGKIPNGNEATIKQLLNHTAGIPDYLNINTILGILNLSVVQQSAEENLEIIYGKKPDFAPGTDMYYSNSNYLMLSLIIKYASGKNANDVVYEKLVRPLGLENTHMSSDIPASLSRGYFDVHDDGKVIDRTEIDNNAVGGQDMLDGGLMANSYDLAVFLKSLMEGDILSTGSLDQMETFEDIKQDLGPDLSHLKQYGLGLMKLETDHGIAIGHYGTVHCFNSLVYYFPEQQTTVAIIRNGDSARSKKFFESNALFNYLF
jgi:D-alanyl-D-alanine carboxypeptidase